jgi:hypothetical protein
MSHKPIDWLILPPESDIIGETDVSGLGLWIVGVTILFAAAYLLFLWGPWFGAL